MIEVDSDLIRHALKTAREFGFRSVRLKDGEMSFSASLNPLSEVEEIIHSTEPEFSNGAATADLESPLVGYFSLDSKVLHIGAQLKRGDRIGSITSVGIANDVTASNAGEVTDVLVADGEPVQFGQILAKVKVS